jgi:hypothetical protein
MIFNPVGKEYGRSPLQACSPN